MFVKNLNTVASYNYMITILLAKTKVLLTWWVICLLTAVMCVTRTKDDLLITYS